MISYNNLKKFKTLINQGDESKKVLSCFLNMRYLCPHLMIGIMFLIYVSGFSSRN